MIATPPAHLMVITSAVSYLQFLWRWFKCLFNNAKQQTGFLSPQVYQVRQGSATIYRPATDIFITPGRVQFLHSRRFIVFIGKNRRLSPHCGNTIKHFVSPPAGLVNGRDAVYIAVLPVYIAPSAQTFGAAPMLPGGTGILHAPASPKAQPRGPSPAGQLPHNLLSK